MTVSFIYRFFGSTAWASLCRFFTISPAMFFRITDLCPIFFTVTHPVFSHGDAESAARSRNSGEYPRLIAACQISLTPGSLTALDTGSLRPSLLVLELSRCAGQTIMSPGCFNPIKYSLVLLRLFQEYCVDDPVLTWPRSYAGLSELCVDNCALGYDSSPLIVYVCRVSDHAK